MRKQMQLNQKARSSVWLEDGWVYKRQAKFLCDNEVWCMDLLWPSGYVPEIERVDLEVIRTKFIERQPITDRKEWMKHEGRVLRALRRAGIRHGDLTVQSIIPHGNKPYLIDFAESRLTEDPRPDKRPEGDEHWLRKTMDEYAPG